MKLPADKVYYTSEIWLYFAHTISFTVTAVYFVREVGMNPFQLILVGTAMELAVFCFEIPTGVLADTYSRRLSLIVGWTIMGVAMILIGSVASFPFIIGGYALWGLGYTFTSGAYEAWITDEVGSDSVGHIFARGQQLSYVGGLLGIGTSVAIASVDLGLAVSVGGAVTLLFAVFAAVFMPERGYSRVRKDERTHTIRELRQTASSGLRFIRMQPLLLIILGIAFFAGASTESFDRLWQAHFIVDIGLPGLANLDPVVWFGIFGAVTMILGLFASEYLVRRFKRIGQARLSRVLLVVTAAQVATVVAFALAGNLVLAAGSMWAYYLTRSLIDPVYDTWINEQITDSSVRATVISITGQSDAIGQVLGGPGLGALGTIFSIRTALLAGGALLAPALALYARAVGHGGSEPELAALTTDNRSAD